jgi:hypothetical protein
MSENSVPPIIQNEKVKNSRRNFMKISFISIVGICAAASAFALFRWWRKWPVSNACAVCGAKRLDGPQYGYSSHIEEDPAKMKPLCRQHLIAQLEIDYENYHERALVIEPASGPPCYVFQPIKEWNGFFKDSKIGSNAEMLLAKMNPQCRDCGQKANYLWVESSGLTGDNFGETLDKGVSETLLVKNPEPISLCGKHCVQRIAAALEQQNVFYLEVCSPKETDNGFVVPMGY